MKLFFAPVRLLLAAICLCITSVGFAQDCKGLHPVSELVRAEQGDLPSQATNFAEIQANRKLRRMELEKLIACEAIKSASDWHKAAYVMLTGPNESDLFKTIEYANRALAIDPQATGSKKMIAYAWDKIMVHRGLPQWYGTQKHDNVLLPIAQCVISNKIRREYEIDEAVIAQQPETCPDKSPNGNPTMRGPDISHQASVVKK